MIIRCARFWAYVRRDYHMKMRRFFSFAILIAAAAALASCAGHPPPSAPPRAVENAPHPIYKVGTPYQINGVWYYPAEDFAYDETGIASWYGEEFHGKYTANGEIFDRNALTAAHRTLPMPCVVQVTNLENGRSIELRVNDRGPYARNRVIDVSRRAAQLLGFEGPGTAKVRVKILVPESIQVAGLARRGGDDKAIAESLPAVPRERVTAEMLSGAPGLRVASTQAMMPSAQARPAPAAPIAAPTLPAAVTTVPVKPTQIYIQAGAFARADNAARAKGRLDPLGPVTVSATRVNGIDLFRVRLGPVRSVDEADKLLDRVVASGLAEARIVVD
jgi:rare lipoprotein A